MGGTYFKPRSVMSVPIPSSSANPVAPSQPAAVSAAPAPQGLAAVPDQLQSAAQPNSPPAPQGPGVFERLVVGLWNGVLWIIRQIFMGIDRLRAMAQVPDPQGSVAPSAPANAPAAPVSGPSAAPQSQLAAADSPELQSPASSEEESESESEISEPVNSPRKKSPAPAPVVQPPITFLQPIIIQQPAAAVAPAEVARPSFPAAIDFRQLFEQKYQSEQERDERYAQLGAQLRNAHNQSMSWGQSEFQAQDKGYGKRMAAQYPVLLASFLS